jgi:hypothetical protein
MGSRSAVAAATRPYQPSTTRHLPDVVAQMLQQARTHARNQVMTGLRTMDPTTPSVQLTGAGGFIDWNIDLEGGMVVVGGVMVEISEVADFDVSHGSAVITNGQSIMAAIVAKNVTGTVTIDKVLGAAAATGDQVAPTDSAITAAVGSSWVKLAEATVNRTGDLTVTQSQNNLLRPELAVTVDTGFGNL